MRGYMKLPFEEEAAVGAVADAAFSGVDLSDTVNERTYVSSIDLAVANNAFTAGQGPIGVYVAHSDYSNAEIAEAIIATGSWDRGDKIAREHAKRLVRLLGVMEIEDDGQEKLWDGGSRKFKLGWLLEEGDTLQFGVFARSGALTSGGQLILLGHANAWLR